MSRLATGGHGGTGGWLAQRISAILMLLGGLLLAVLLACGAPADYAAWRLFFAGELVKILCWTLVVTIGLHGWIGLRDVLMDYVKPLSLRLVLDVGVLLAVVFYAIWAAMILWGVQA